MIKEALQYIVGLSVPEVTEINGETYSDKSLVRISHNPKAEQIGMSTLSSLVEYIKSKADKMGGMMFVQVKSPTEVILFSNLDADREREYLVGVNAEIPKFRFDTFIPSEEFIISLQSKFIDSDDRGLLLKFSGTVEAGTVSNYGDDGVTQKATIKTGIASTGDAKIPNPVELKPYRTFVEVEQPTSQFVFRMKQDKYDGVQCAVFEADGGAWKGVAMEYIKEYLTDALKEMNDFIVIS